MSILLHLQNFLSLNFQTILSLIKICVLSDVFKFKLSKSTDQKKDMIILANGPSLKTDLDKISNINDYDLLAVNHFAEDILYNTLKPSYYCINAPELFLDVSSVEVEKRRDTLFFNLYSKTSWNLTLFVINNSKNHYKWKNIISDNSNIKIQYYNNTPINGFRFFKFFSWRNNIGMPPPHNVLIPSIIQSINLNYKRILLVGVDHSWLNEIAVTEDNLVLLNQKHFYDRSTSKHMPMIKDSNNIRKLHEILHKFYFTFKGYHQIEDFANNYNVSIFNLTSGSYIDAFKRLEKC